MRWLPAVAFSFLLLSGLWNAASCAPTSAPADTFHIDIERGESKTAVYIEPRAEGMVRLTGVDGTVEYVPLYRIQKILDSTGADRIREVRRGERLGGRGSRPPPGSGPAVWKPLRLGAAPGALCGAYAITDYALLWRVGRYSTDDRHFVSLDYGYARNIGPRRSIGGTAFLVANGARVQTGLRLRLTRWLSPKVSVEVAPGIILAADEVGGTRFKGPGFVGQAGLTVSGRFGLVGQVFSVRREVPSWVSSVPPHETAWHLGFKLGGEPGIIAMVATAVLGAIAASQVTIFGD